MPDAGILRSFRGNDSLRECQVRICEGLGVKFPGPTRQNENPPIFGLCQLRPAADFTDPNAFRSGRDFAAWIGLVPRQDSTGGKQKLGPISKQGDRYLRRLLVVGAHAVLRRAKQSPQKYPWLAQLLARRPFKVVAIALANKMARVAWALLAKGGTYQAPVLAAA